MRSLAPIAVFAYNRPKHLATTLESLVKNVEARESDVYIYIDGPRNEADVAAQGEIDLLLSNRDLMKQFKSVKFIRAAANKGLARSIIDGVTHVVSQSDRVIVLEDDMVLSPYFLKFMNDGLDKYANDERVISIHGYVVPAKKKFPQTFFLRGADCWGWATWKRGWDLFEQNGRKLLHEIRTRRLEKEFNYGGSYDYSGMLEGQIAGKNDSWAIRWYASAFLKDKLTLYPGRSLVKNIGFDGSGTNCDPTTEYDVEFSTGPIPVNENHVEHSDHVYKIYREFFKSNHPKLFKRLLGKAKKLVRVFQ